MCHNSHSFLYDLCLYYTTILCKLQAFVLHFLKK
nr:MAG TPA: hypothetical protein [Caudoviricetes sp.]DAY54077.1 MAG TPA: hypothetical protein [Caudoviricetes sp.]